MSEKIIHFEHGIPGFLDEREFIYQIANQDSPFGYLQSVANEHLAFIVTSPFLFFPDYTIDIPDETVARLEIESPEDVVVFSIVTLHGELKTATANLLAPVVINLRNLKGEQVILEKTKYTTRHLLFPQHTIKVGGE